MLHSKYNVVSKFTALRLPMGHVLKIKYGGNTRRLVVPSAFRRRTGAFNRELKFSYADLQSVARNLFKLPATTPLSFTYEDKDGDGISLMEDQDLRDALVVQALNPLRITIVSVGLDSDALTVEKEPEASKKEGRTKAPQDGMLPVSLKDGDPERKRGGKDHVKNARLVREGKVQNSHVPIEIQGNDLGMVLIKGSNNVHSGTECCACNMSPVRGPLFRSTFNHDLCGSCFKSRNQSEFTGYAQMKSSDVDHNIRCKDCGTKLMNESFLITLFPKQDLCLGCFAVIPEADRNLYMKVEQEFYRLAHPTFDVKEHAIAFSNGNFRGRWEEIFLGTSNRARNSGVQHDECEMQPINGAKLRRHKTGKCNPCSDNNNVGSKASTGAGNVAMGNKIPTSVPPLSWWPGYVCNLGVLLLDPWTICVQEISKSLMADSKVTFNDALALRLAAQVPAYRLPHESFENLSADPKIIYMSDNRLKVLVGYVVQNCNDSS